MEGIKDQNVSSRADSCKSGLAQTTQIQNNSAPDSHAFTTSLQLLFFSQNLLYIAYSLGWEEEFAPLNGMIAIESDSAGVLGATIGVAGAASPGKGVPGA
jgi:hypothetical protein